MVIRNQNLPHIPTVIINQNLTQITKCRSKLGSDKRGYSGLKFKLDNHDYSWSKFGSNNHGYSGLLLLVQITIIIQNILGHNLGQTSVVILGQNLA